MEDEDYLAFRQLLIQAAHEAGVHMLCESRVAQMYRLFCQFGLWKPKLFDQPLPAECSAELHLDPV